MYLNAYRRLDSPDLKTLYCKERRQPPKESAEMTANQWPGLNEKQVIAEMLKNRDSAHWEKCCELMRWFILQQANKLSVTLTADLENEILQNAMESVITGLPNLRDDSILAN